MKITLVVVVSEDGFITRGDNPNPSNWSPNEDKQHYHKILSENNVYVMGQ